jgi:hypothetical protein
LSWDDPIPSEISSEWKELSSTLPLLSEISIRRNIIPVHDSTRLELHGFCDASEAVYGAVLYVKCVTADSAVSVMLLTSKSRVAPVKKQILPRLEICGALLLARLVHKVRKALPFEKMNGIYLWTDSTIVLHWLHRAPNCWKTFVANYVAEIQDLTYIEDWRRDFL